MNVHDVVEVLETIAPLRHAEAWDNVGLLIGTHDDDASRILLTIDLTEAVVEEAIERDARLIIAYHPVIFDPLTRLDDASPKSRIALRVARNGLAVYAPHTALDAAPGGVNDWLAGGVGDGDTRALVPGAEPMTTATHKLVTFCPKEAVHAIRDALAAVGAGRIGAYRRCVFTAPGHGSFEGGPGTNPTRGRRGRLETVPEVRLEMVCPSDALALAATTLRQVHPYEEPPLEIYALTATPQRTMGAGRRVVLDRKVSLKTLVNRVKTRLALRQVRVATAASAPRQHETIGVCAGAGGSLATAAMRQGCTVFLTGEMRHHDVLDAQQNGCTVILAGHTNTERGYLRTLRSDLAERLPDAEILVSRRDADPLKTM